MIGGMAVVLPLGGGEPRHRTQGGSELLEPPKNHRNHRGIHPENGWFSGIGARTLKNAFFKDVRKTGGSQALKHRKGCSLAAACWPVRGRPKAGGSGLQASDIQSDARNAQPYGESVPSRRGRPFRIPFCRHRIGDLNLLIIKRILKMPEKAEINEK